MTLVCTTNYKMFYSAVIYSLCVKIQIISQPCVFSTNRCKKKKKCSLTGLVNSDCTVIQHDTVHGAGCDNKCYSDLMLVGWRLCAFYSHHLKEVGWAVQHTRHTWRPLHAPNTLNCKHGCLQKGVYLVHCVLL